MCGSGEIVAAPYAVRLEPHYTEICTRRASLAAPPCGMLWLIKSTYGWSCGHVAGAGKTSLINTLRLGRHRPDLAPLGLQLATFGAPAPASGSDSGTSSSTASEASASTGAFDVQTDMPFIPAEALGFGKGAADGSRSAGPSLASGGEETGPEEDEEAELEWLAVGSVSKIGRGKHTTTTVRLIKLLGGGMLADTPGFGQPSLDGCVADGPASSRGSCHATARLLL